MRISVIVNTGEVGELAELRAEVAELRREGHAVMPRVTFEAGDARKIARRAAEAGHDLVIAAGGDGTVHEVTNGLHDAMAAAAAGGSPPRAPALGIVPLGTANDLANGLELPPSIGGAMRVAVCGSALEVDVGTVGDRCFLNVSTGGFAAEATGEAGSEAKRALGPLAYVITGARKFAALEVSRASFVADGPIYDGAFLIFAVGNYRRTGGGNLLTPRADLSDGLLDLCVVKEISRLELLALLPDLRSGTHLDHPAVIYRQVPRVVVESERDLSVNADGEPLQGRRFDYGVSPYRLTLMVSSRR